MRHGARASYSAFGLSFQILVARVDQVQLSLRVQAPQVWRSNTSLIRVG